MHQARSAVLATGAPKPPPGRTRTEPVTPHTQPFDRPMVVGAVVVVGIAALSWLSSGALAGATTLAAGAVGLLVCAVIGLRRDREAGADGPRSAAQDLTALRTAFYEAPMGCLVVDSDGTVLEANAAAHSTLGRAPRTLTGFTLAELELERGPDVGLGDAGGDSPLTFRHPDGSGRRLRLHSAPAHGPEAPSARVVWIEDLSLTRRLTREVEEAAARLRHVERLETLGTLAGGLAHDLNNLLAPILGHVDLALADLDDQEVDSGAPAREDLEMVRSAAHRASDLTTRLLHLSRPDQNHVEPVELQGIVEEVTALIRPMKGARVDIETNLDAGCPPVLGTKTQLHQVLLNLCKNALHAMPAGGKLTVGVDHADALATWETHPAGDGPFARVRVSDTGTGMDDETRRKIFDPFFTTKGSDKGSGLGLSMVKSIVSGCNGTISVKSVPGRGTVFTLLFPTSQERRRATRPIPLRPTSDADRDRSGRILLVDDDAAVLDVLARTLARLGHTVTEFESSGEALEAFLERPDDYDLLLTDQMMPELTGLELLAQVREARPDLPAVLTTGRVDAVARGDLERLRCDLLPKPSSTNELKEAVLRGLAHPTAA